MADPSAGNFTVAQLRASVAASQSNVVSSQPAASEAAAPPREEGPTMSQKMWHIATNLTDCIHVRCVNYRVLNTSLWKAATSFFTVVLLFGSQIHHLWLPPNADGAMDVLYGVTFLFFMVDMGLRVYAEPNYFQFQFGLCWYHNNTSFESGSCLLGSFMFWCDFISMMTLLYEISKINQGLAETPEVTIDLDDHGRPVSKNLLLREHVVTKGLTSKR